MPIACPATPATSPALTRLMVDWAELERAGSDSCWCRASHCWCADVGSPGVCLDRLVNGDDLLALRLLARARAGDVAAARVVLQALVPRLAQPAARLGAELPAAPNQLAFELGLAWERVVRHQPRSATNVLDNLARSCRRTASVERGRELPLAHPERLVHELRTARVGEADGPRAGQVIISAFVRGLVDSTTAELLADVYVHGMTARRAGELRGLGEQAVRDRCHRALRRIRQAELCSGDGAPGAA